MKKLLTTMIVCSAAYFSISQENTLPTTGNIGIGTLTPNDKLTVNGNVSINDSLRVNKTIRVMDKLFIEGKTVMDDNAVVKQNFRVQGNTRFNGNAKVEGSLKLPNATSLSNSNFSQGNFDFLLLNENGVAKKGGSNDILSAIYSPVNKQCIVGPIPNPTWSNGTNKVFVNCPQVFVGISTNTPRSALDVRGTTFTRKIAVGIAPDDMVGKVHVKTISTNPNAKILTIENDTRKLLTLDNSGLMKAREIKVDAQAWPDYVFKPNYELMPLSEVEIFIKKEGHLPAFPSAQEIEENGMNVYETNKLLVEKIEELTLHLIAQEKQLKEQNLRLQELENKK